RGCRIPPDHKYVAKLPRTLLERVRAAEAAGGVALTRVQAETIGEMRLIQLVGLEIEKLVNDYTAVVGEIEGYEVILADHGKVLAILRNDLEEMRARYGSPRLTTIEDADVDGSVAELIPVTDVAVTD